MGHKVRILPYKRLEDQLVEVSFVKNDAALGRMG
jgi:hypothetical protein